MSRFQKLALAGALSALLAGTFLIVSPVAGAAKVPAAKPSPQATVVQSGIIACPSPYTAGFRPAPKSVPAGCPAPCPALHVNSPQTIGGLVVGREDPCGDFQASNPSRALDAVSLFSLREPTQLLIATLEVGRFSAQAPLSDPSFRQGVISQIGSTEPEALWLGGTEVFATSTTGLTLISWFRGRYLFILAVRDNYSEPKSLVRDALRIEP